MGETQAERAAKQESIAREVLPQLQLLAADLEALASDIFAERIPYDPTDSANLMALSYATKQREHLRSVRLLIDHGAYRDAFLLARTMLEALGRLLWAFRQRPERTDLWLWYGAILDWRQILDNEATGMAVDPDEKAALKQLVDQHGNKYIRGEVRNRLSDPTYPIPVDPWLKIDWTVTSVKDMFDEIGGTYHYEGLYRDACEWIHSGPRAILRAMEPTPWGVAGFSEADWPTAARALYVGCDALLQSLEVLELQFALGLSERLAALVQKRSAISYR